MSKITKTLLQKITQKGGTTSGVWEIHVGTIQPDSTVPRPKVEVDWEGAKKGNKSRARTKALIELSTKAKNVPNIFFCLTTDINALHTVRSHEGTLLRYH